MRHPPGAGRQKDDGRSRARMRRTTAVNIRASSPQMRPSATSSSFSETTNYNVIDINLFPGSHIRSSSPGASPATGWMRTSWTPTYLFTGLSSEFVTKHSPYRGLDAYVGAPTSPWGSMPTSDMPLAYELGVLYNITV